MAKQKLPPERNGAAALKAARKARQRKRYKAFKNARPTSPVKGAPTMTELMALQRTLTDD